MKKKKYFYTILFLDDYYPQEIDQKTQLPLPTGLAMVFRRTTLDQQFDLMCDFDESYWHSAAQGVDLKYLVSKTDYKEVQMLTKYTDDINKIIGLVDTSDYQIQYSWDDAVNK